MSDYVLGIDPGATGALALFNSTEGYIEFVIDIPHYSIILTTKKKTNKIDIEKLIQLFAFVEQKVGIDNNLYVHIEKVQAFGKQSAPAAFNFGYAAAIPYTIAKCFNLQVKMIPPQRWKQQYNLQASDKDEARLLALEIFPYLAEELKRKKDVDRADAILIACYKP